MPLTVHARIDDDIPPLRPNVDLGEIVGSVDESRIMSEEEVSPSPGGSLHGDRHAVGDKLLDLGGCLRSIGIDDEDIAYFPRDDSHVAILATEPLKNLLPGRELLLEGLPFDYGYLSFIDRNHRNMHFQIL